jgi:hypothetical protein
MMQKSGINARHVVLVGEIASPSTRVYDRTTKRAPSIRGHHVGGGHDQSLL